MADPDDQIAVSDDEEGGGGSKSKLPLIIVVFVVLLGAIGAVFFLLIGGEDAPGTPNEATPKPTPGLQVPMDKPFVVNLQGDRIANIDMTFEIKAFPEGVLEEEAVGEWMPVSDKNKFTQNAKIRDTVMSILRSKEVTQLQSDVGIKKIKQEIKNALNQNVLTRSRVEEVYFPTLVVQ